MDLSIILTYRCNSKCSMCHIWQHPTNTKYEIRPEVFEKLPSGYDYINLTGGEPTLRHDLERICDILYPKTKKLEISTNGLKKDRLIKIVKKYKDIKIRISMEGIGEVNDKIRGEIDGYNKKIETMKSLIEAGGCDLGFATTFQDENIDQILDMYHLSKTMGVELATSALHNGFQFHKNDNFIYDRIQVAKKVEDLIIEMLKSKKIKDWFRAYLNLGLIAKILGHPRLHKCTQGTDNVFIDPWGDVYACNVRNDLYMGNIIKQTWEEVYYGELAEKVRKKVANCPFNCWMVSSAKTAMRNKYFPKLPKLAVFNWVLINKIRVSLGLNIPFSKYVNYNSVYKDTNIIYRKSYLNEKVKREIQPSKSDYYKKFEPFINK